MVEPLGEEFIRIRPDASGFRAELQAQIGAVLPAAQAQISAMQAQTARAAGAARERVTAGGVILPGAVRSVQEAARAQTQLTATTSRSREQLRAFATAQRATIGSTAASVAATQNMQRSVNRAETSIGRYSRGMVAATAASTGFFRAVSFASGAFLFGAVIGATIGAATQEFVEMTRVGAQTIAILRSTGGVARVTAADIDRLAESQLRLTGIDDELTKASANVILTFRGIRNAGEGVNAVFDRSVRAATDISTVLGTNLRSSSIQVGKALQDPVLGVTALRRAGITLSQSQRQLIKDLVASGQMLRAQKLILAEIETQVGGTARAIGETLPGRLRIMREEAVNSLGEMVARLSESRQAAELAAQGADILSAAWAAVRETVRTVGPPLLGIIQGVGRATGAIGGAPTLVAAVAAYAGVRLAARAAGAAQALFTAASAGAARAALAQAIAVDASTVALERRAAAETTAAAAAQRTIGLMTSLTAVMAIGAVFSGQYATAALFGGIALLGLATKARAAVVSLRAAGAAVNAMSVASLALGGPLGIAALTVGALAVGFFAIRSRAGAAAGSVRGFENALRGLNDALAEGQRLREEAAAAGEVRTEARLSEQQARREVAELRAQQVAQRAAPGSLAARALADRRRAAEERLAIAIQKRAEADRAANEIARQQQQNRQAFVAVMDETRRKVEREAAAARELGTVNENLVEGSDEASRALQIEILRRDRAAEAVQKFSGVMAEMAKSSDFASQVVGRTLGTITAQLGAVPDQKTIDIVLRFAGEGRLPAFILEQVGAIGAVNEIEQIRMRNAMQMMNLTGQTNILLQQQESAARALVRAETERVEKSKQRRNDAQRELEQMQEALRTAREGLRTAREALAAARQALVDTIRSSREAVNQAVSDAKANLSSIADSVADALGRIQEAGGETVSAELTARFRRLRDEIIAGGGGPETRRAAQQIAALSEAQRAAPEDTAERARRRLGDLADALNRGRLSVGQFRDRLDKILRGFGFDREAFARQFGTAARNELLDQIRALGEQAAAIAAGPQRPGGPQVNIVRPLDAVAQANRQIADATRDVKDAIRNVHEAERDFRRAVVDESKAQTRLNRRNNFLTQRTNELIAAQNDLLKVERVGGGTRPKPTGSAAEEAAGVTRRGGR